MHEFDCFIVVVQIEVIAHSVDDIALHGTLIIDDASELHEFAVVRRREACGGAMRIAIGIQEVSKTSAEQGKGMSGRSRENAQEEHGKTQRHGDF